MVIAAQIDRLEGEIAARKAAIRREREALRTAAAQLAELKQRCADLGIGLRVEKEGSRQWPEPH